MSIFEKFKEGLREGRYFDPTPARSSADDRQWSNLLAEMERRGQSVLRQSEAFPGVPEDDVMVDFATDALARANDGMAAMAALIDQKQSEIAALNGQLDFERGRVADLAAKLQATSSKGFDAGPATRAYEYLGLTPSLPDFAIKACRTAFRKATHPDKARTPEAKAWSEEAFKAAESAFDVIYEHKGISR